MAPKTSAHSLRRVPSESEISDMEDSSRKSYRDYKVKRSHLIGMVNWTHVFKTYIPYVVPICFIALIGQIIYQITTELYNSFLQTSFYESDVPTQMKLIIGVVKDLLVTLIQYIPDLWQDHDHPLLSSSVKITVLILIVLVWIIRMDNPVYCMSFATFKPPSEWKVTQEQIMEIFKAQEVFTEESLDFMSRMLERSGTGNATAYPPGIVQCLKGKKADRSIERSREEAETIICDIVARALEKANCSPKEIDILVINCSLFSPTPSLCALVASKFGMRSDVQTYNLSGMGCSASLISINLAKDLLQRRSLTKSSKALVVSTEILTPNLYYGNERGFLLQNTLFRCGGAAIVLSNKWTDGPRAWYKLLHTVRVQGTDDPSYQAVYETQDAINERGVRLSKEIVKVAGKCMEKNMTMLGPYVLPLGEQIKVVYSLVVRFITKKLVKILETKGIDKKLPIVPVYVPDFKRGIDHFCIHAGGRAVIDGIEKNMKLELFHTEPSRMTLLNYGNTSSSSIWYELEYIQDMQKSNPLKKGHRIMQVAFGSGFKCTSAVWLKL